MATLIRNAQRGGRELGPHISGFTGRVKMLRKLLLFSEPEPEPVLVKTESQPVQISRNLSRFLKIHPVSKAKPEEKKKQSSIF